MPESRFDVLVVGAGPAGMAAAVAATRAGRSVGVVDDNPEAGGQIWRGESVHPTTAESRKAFEAFRSCGAAVFQGTHVVACEGPRVLIGERDGRPLRLEGDAVVLATGGRERFLPFPGWTLPNVTGAGGLQSLVKFGLPIKGKRVLLAGSGPLLLAVAAKLVDEGAKVVGLCEQANFGSVARFGMGLLGAPGKLLQAIELKFKLRGVPSRFGVWPRRANGNGLLESVTLTDGGREWDVPCDHFGCGFGLVPNVELAALLGCELGPLGVHVNERCETSIPGVHCVGESIGIGGHDTAAVEGTIAGMAAAGQDPSPRFDERRKARRFADRLEKAFELRDELRSLAEPDTIVCRCEDVRMRDVQPYDDMLSAKLQTRLGMGPCQGRVCGPALEFVKGWSRGSVRPPIFPASLSTLADDASTES